MELSHLTYFSHSDSNTIEGKVERFFSIRQNPTTFKPIIRNLALCVAKVTSNDIVPLDWELVKLCLFVCVRTQRRNFRAAEVVAYYYKLRQEKEIGLRFWLRGHKIVHVCRDLQINLPRSFGHPAAVVEAQQPWPLQSTVYCCCSRCKTFAKKWDNDAHYQSQLLLRNSKFITENQLVIIKKVKKSLNDVCHISSDRSNFKWGYLSFHKGANRGFQYLP